ncbi:uncharacterized protein PV07_08437 [Cladophialophora immunda]|uniref:Uncharacterized protein n=1 Tax=Cladophialophora immunda TaxID=569365 RepID=A0A0D2C1S1_9EURO|nr:uncharacterized protein PV07_08437 [Cladophialophora immunda]KIW25243.1 hypothetical protein PV07_08437 [Cladophialophora immunda]OQV00294.1 hypothetical protein CLAIMM_05812 [Cladophialophora immunda]
MGVLQQTLPLSLIYFSLVFLSGLILGSIRVPYLQPLLGARYAELFEMPIMLIVIWQAAQVTVWNLDSASAAPAGSKRPLASMSTSKWSLLKFLTSPPPTPLMIGALALVWLLAVELAVSVVAQMSLHGGSWWDGVYLYVAGRDVVAGPVYATALLAYAVMPWVAWLSQTQEDTDKLLWDFDETQAEQEDYCSR